METANPFLENPLLIAAILLFLAILPRALRQREKTALDKAVERFEKEEMKAAAEGRSLENTNKHQKPIPLKDGSFAYPKVALPSSPQTEEPGGIPPFPTHEEHKVKIVKPGVPISHFETAEPPPKKKVKLIKQSFSIAPSENKASSNKNISEPLEVKLGKPPTDEKKSAVTEDFPVPPAIDTDESGDNWIEAEIPGLSIEPPAEEKTEEIPVFNASPKQVEPLDADKSEAPLLKEKQDSNVKNTASETEEKKDSKPEKQTPDITGSPEAEKEISKSKPKEVEIKASVVSHKKIDKTETESPSSRPEPPEEKEEEFTAAFPEREQQESSPAAAKLKPFLLDLRYLDTEDEEAEDSKHTTTTDKTDATIAHLNALQVALENQFRTIPGKTAQKRSSADKKMRKERIHNLPPDQEEIRENPSAQREVSLQELDSFLFTATQKQKKE